MFDFLNAISFVIVYGVLFLIAFVLYKLVQRTKWNPWFKALAIAPFITYWILTYQPADAVYHYTFEDVTGQNLPEKFEIIEKYQSPYDDFGDYTAYAIYEVDPSSFEKISNYFKSKLVENRSLHETPKKVQEYLHSNPNKRMKIAYHYWKKGGLELYGATLDDKKTVIVFRSSW